jgi:hypothetical protein
MANGFPAQAIDANKPAADFGTVRRRIRSRQSGLEQIIYKNYVIWTNSIAVAIGRMFQQCSLKKANMA